MNNRAGRSGFTLIEVLIAITVASVLGAGILALVLGQNRFYSHNDGAIYAEQSLRAAMDLMASELRMASPYDLMEAEPDRVSVHFDIIRAVVCAVPGGVDVFVYDSVANANLPADFRGTAVSGPYDDFFVYAPGYDATGSQNGAAKNNCTNNGAPPGEPNSRYRRISDWSVGYGSDPEVGSVVRVYGRLSYRFADSGFGPGLAVWRNAQELVSPFDEGARFQYVMADGSVQNSVASADLDEVRTIRIDVVARGGGVNRYGVERDMVYDVPLRN